MRSMSGDWEESFLALEHVELPANDWQEYPSPQERQARSYSIAVVEEAVVKEAEMSGFFVVPGNHDLKSGYSWSRVFELIQSRFGLEQPSYASWFPGLLSLQQPGARAETTSLRADTEVIALRGKIAALEDEQDRLRERLQRLEGKLDEILSTPGEMETVPVDPHTRWIQENLETLRNHPDEWIALHPVRGILFHTADGEAFAGMLDRLSADERDEVLAFHSSMYI
jgi:hypothetical protein